ncbi:MAG: SecDF P1 head subdomain-containing protein [Acidimicrobiales bacterium]
MRVNAVALTILASALAVAPACGTSSDADLVAALTTTTSQPPTTAALSPADALAACVASRDVDPTALRPSDPVVGVDAEGVEYCLGPVELTGEAIEDVVMVSDDWAPSVDVTLSPVGIVAFNTAAARCFEAEPTCPFSQLAIVADGDVISAPRIATPSFERDQIQIGGPDETRLAQLIDAVESSPASIEFRPVIAEVPFGMSLESIADILDTKD